MNALSEISKKIINYMSMHPPRTNQYLVGENGQEVFISSKQTKIEFIKCKYCGGGKMINIACQGCGASF